MSVENQKQTFSPTGALDPMSMLVVIPALNEARHIEACIRSLMTGEPMLRDVPLIVADGGSHDATVDTVKRLKGEFPNLDVIHNPEKLQAAAVNLVARTRAVAETRYLIRCDAHSIYPDNFIIDVTASLQRSGAASLVVPMDATGETCFERANAWIVDTPLGSGGAAHRGGQRSGFVDHGHHAGFDLEAFRAIGGYDETFSHNEDAEYDQRLTASGRRIYLDATIRIAYVPRPDLITLGRQYYRYGHGRARNVRKHGQALKLRQALPLIALLANAAGLLAATVFWPAILVPLAYVGVLILAALWMLVRHRSLCALWCAPILGTMHMSWAMGFLARYLRGSGQVKP